MSTQRGAPMADSELKNAVHDFWNTAACGEQLLLPATDEAGYRAQSAERYRLEPFIAPFAQFESAAGLDVLEIGLGLGADHERFAAAGARLHGVDLTSRAVEITRARLSLSGLSSDLRTADAECLPFDDAVFDLVYSWGVIHHTPDTPAAAREILRVLRPGGTFRVMIYNRWSLVGLMLWTRYAFLRGRPAMSLDEVYARYLESPGTKAYTAAEARNLFRGAKNVAVRTVLTHGDLLESGAGQRHEGRLLDVARLVWPRWLLRRLCPGMGLFMLIEGNK